MAHGWVRVRELLHDGVGASYPGAVLLVTRNGDEVFFEAAGTTACPGQGIDPGPAGPKTAYDLASLTKPLATAFSIADIVGRGAAALDDPLSAHLEFTRDTDKAELTIRQLLAHASGLPAWRPYGADLCRTHGEDVAGTPEARESVTRSIVGEALESPPGRRTEYSDLGFILLGMLVEGATGLPLDLAFSRQVASPVGLHDAFFVPVRHGVAQPATGDRSIAATELCPTRRRVLCGEVHDDNAWVLGGMAGHAGLFANAADVAAVCAAWLASWHGTQGAPLPTRVVREMWDRGSTPGDSTRVMGFDTPTPGASSAGLDAPATLVGHLGFTGTSLWMDPVSSTTVVLLTNRVHPSRENDAIRELRPLLHDAVWEALSNSRCAQTTDLTNL